MQTDSEMSFVEIGCQTDGAFHSHATAGTAIQDGDSLMGSINARADGHVPEMQAVHRMARRQSRRDSVVNVGTFGHAPAGGKLDSLVELSEEERLSRYQGGRTLAGQRRASAERVILG